MVAVRLEGWAEATSLIYLSELSKQHLSRRSESSLEVSKSARPVIGLAVAYIPHH